LCSASRHSDAAAAWSKWVRLLLELAVDFGIIHMMLALQACRIQELPGHVGFTQILKAGLAGQEKYGMVRVPLQST
jgi:hypothetical protein